jgi:hypothetical protein
MDGDLETIDILWTQPASVGNDLALTSTSTSETCLPKTVVLRIGEEHTHARGFAEQAIR